jgi:LysR family transcriptional regulator, low CO2-responsive transcriptional regulator
MLSLYKLEIYMAVALEGSFSQGAKRMQLTQPAVSQHMRDLEQSLGTELFVRGPRGVTLTAAGEILLDYTRCILRLVDEAESAVLQLEQLSEGQLTLGATPGASVYLLPAWIQKFHQRFSGLAISLRTDTTPNLLKGITVGQVDLAFVEGELQIEPAIHALGLREIRLFVVVGSSHPWADRTQIQLAELDRQAYISRPQGSQTRNWIDQIFSQNGIRPEIAAEFDNPESIRQAVASGMGFTIMAEWGLGREAFGPQLHALEIAGLELRRTLKLVWASGTPLKPISRAFLTLLLDEFPQLSQLAAGQISLNLRLPGRENYRASVSGCASGTQEFPQAQPADQAEMDPGSHP